MYDTLALTCIRCETEHDLADAVALAARILKKSPQPRHLERTTFDFSTQLFAGVALVVAYAHKNGTVTDVLQYLVDPAWDCSLQMLDSFQQAEHAFRQLQAAAWRHDFLNSIKAKSYTEVETLVRRCHAHWTTALNSLTTIAPEKRQPRASIQVFNPEAVANALHQNASLRDDKRAGSGRILEDAQRNHGYRTVPDCKKAGAQLQATQCHFENLVQPIARLQSRLVLAGCMSPEAFHIPPFLLLGEPGVGKTHFAMQLAQSLGVGMAKISAGGAQGGFQLTGSHTSWTGARPGSLTALLAAGKSAAPVVVIDEIDKIVDAQYPVLPVLLDLLERGTAQQFRDEFFEMEIDASKIIFVLTANSTVGVPESLLSRVEVFNVPRPEAKQRLRIIHGIAEKLCQETGLQITLDQRSSQRLAERQEIDLRAVTRLVEDAFAKAIAANKTMAYPWVHEHWAEALNALETGQRMH